MKIGNFSSQLHLNTPASDSAILQVEAELGIQLPGQYKTLLKLTNGLTSYRGVFLYSTEDLAERNITFEVQVYASGYLAIGDDSGDRLFMISLSADEPVIYGVDQGALSSKWLTPLSGSLEQWLQDACPAAIEESSTETEPNTVDVYLECLPPGGVRDLLFIKRELGIEQSISDIKNNLANVPVCILKEVPFGKFSIRCRKINEQSKCLGLRALDGRSIKF